MPKRSGARRAFWKTIPSFRLEALCPLPCLNKGQVHPPPRINRRTCKQVAIKGRRNPESKAGKGNRTRWIELEMPSLPPINGRHLTVREILVGIRFLLKGPFREVPCQLVGGYTYVKANKASETRAVPSKLLSCNQSVALCVKLLKGGFSALKP